jgi:hypothetical protein
VIAVTLLLLMLFFIELIVGEHVWLTKIDVYLFFNVAVDLVFGLLDEILAVVGFYRANKTFIVII